MSSKPPSTCAYQRSPNIEVLLWSLGRAWTGSNPCRSDSDCRWSWKRLIPQTGLSFDAPDGLAPCQSEKSLILGCGIRIYNSKAVLSLSVPHHTYVQSDVRSSCRPDNLLLGNLHTCRSEGHPMRFAWLNSREFKVRSIISCLLSFRGRNINVFFHISST
jgi:hypothetical protein